MCMYRYTWWVLRQSLQDWRSYTRPFRVSGPQVWEQCQPDEDIIQDTKAGLAKHLRVICYFWTKVAPDPQHRHLCSEVLQE